MLQTYDKSGSCTAFFFERGTLCTRAISVNRVPFICFYILMHTLQSKYMAQQLKGKLVKGPYKPIHIETVPSTFYCNDYTRITKLASTFSTFWEFLLSKPTTTYRGILDTPKVRLWEQKLNSPKPEPWLQFLWNSSLFIVDPIFFKPTKSRAKIPTCLFSWLVWRQVVKILPKSILWGFYYERLGLNPSLPKKIRFRDVNAMKEGKG